MNDSKYCVVQGEKIIAFQQNFFVSNEYFSLFR